MTNTTGNQALADRIERLVQEHIAASRKSAQEAVERAFAPAAGARPVRAARQVVSRAGGGKRRATAELAEVGERLYQAVCAKPGVGMTVLAAELGASARELNRPMASLKRAGQRDSNPRDSRDGICPRMSNYTRVILTGVFYPGNMAPMPDARTFVAFSGSELLAEGDIETVIRRLVGPPRSDRVSSALVFEESTGTQVDFDLRGSAEDAIARLENHPLFGMAPGATKQRSGPGRPRLGVVSREVSLLPRHWAWLEAQPGGISGALRRLVDNARRREPGKERARIAREALSKILWVVAGNFVDFEEASRALYANDAARFAQLVAEWPADVRSYSLSRLHNARHLEVAAEPT